MDGYVKLGLILIAVVVLLWIIDSWYKKRYARAAETASFNGKSTNSEFAINYDSEELFDRVDTVGPSRIVSVTHDAAATRYNTPNKKRGAFFAENNLLILSVMAKPATYFASYDLLQAISNAGMRFGEMNIFHYYQEMTPEVSPGATKSPTLKPSTIDGKIKLFSLVSANKPGDFDLDNIGDFSCTGLMLFMNSAEVADPQHTFKLMLETAERLVEDLDGVLHADPLTPWNEKIAWQYQKKLFNLKSR